MVISRTVDGGRNWQSVTLPGDWGGREPVVAFSSTAQGFVLLAGLRGGGPSAVFFTEDGGVTWRLTSRTDDLGAIFGVANGLTLWAGNQGDAGPVSRPILDVSRDLGTTWSDARLPGLVGDIYVNDTLVAPPYLDGADGAVAVLAESSASPPAFLFYRTTDGGLTWARLATIPQNDHDTAAVAVVDDLHFVALDPVAGVVQSTADGGDTWDAAPMVGFEGARRLHFWDPRDGVAIVQLSNGSAPAAGVFRTVDGGRTWTPLVPPSST